MYLLYVNIIMDAVMSYNLAHIFMGENVFVESVKNPYTVHPVALLPLRSLDNIRLAPQISVSVYPALTFKNKVEQVGQKIFFVLHAVGQSGLFFFFCSFLFFFFFCLL